MVVLKRKQLILDMVKNGAKSALGFGLLVTIVHLAIGIALIISLGMPPLTWFAAKTLFIEPPLAVMFGLLLCPIQLLKKGRFIQPAVMTLIWIAMEHVVAVDPAKPQMWLAPPVVTLALYYLFQWIWQKKPRICVAAAVIAPAVILAAPIIAYKLGGGYDIKAQEKSGAPPKGAPDVVLIVMDTVRGHNISALGYERKTSPVFDAFAKEGVLFERATAPATWSLPAHASLFTGAFPSVHKGHAETRFLDDKMPTLAESLAENGYDTMCFTANPHITPGFGLTRGFGWNDNAWITGAGGRAFTFIYRLIDSIGMSAAEDKGGALVASNVANWMSQRPQDASPAFVFVNILEAHFPFRQLPEKYRNTYNKVSLSNLRVYDQMAFGAQMARQLTDEELNTIRQPILDLYDGGISYTDYLVGQIIDVWKKRGTLDNTIFVILADHGEHTGEHDMFGHLTSLYQEDLWVPFMLRYPPKIPAGKRVAQEVSTIATFATIFDLIGIKPPDTLQIGSLLPALKTPTPGEPPPAFGRPAISERFEEHLLSSRFKPGTANGKGPALSPFGRYRAYRSGKFKLVRHFMDGKYTTSLFNLDSDPGEMKDLADEPTAIYDLQQMEKELADWEILLKLPALDGKAAAAPAAGSSKLSDEAKEQLKALGYIGE